MRSLPFLSTLTPYAAQWTQLRDLPTTSFSSTFYRGWIARQR
jgi:hypothetical protein